MVKLLILCLLGIVFIVNCLGDTQVVVMVVPGGLLLDCSTVLDEGGAPISLVWYKNNDLLASIPGRIAVTATQVSFMKTGDGDAGEYVCTSQEADRFSRTFKVISAKRQVEALEATAGKYVVLSNEGIVHGPLQWTKDGKPIVSSRFLTTNESLTITSITKSDQGVYTGTKGNDKPELVFSVTVKADVRVLQVPKKLVMECNTTSPIAGQPPIKVDWYKDNHPLSTEDGRLIVTSNKVDILQSKDEDVGEYTCEAQDRGFSHTFTVLTVSYRKLPKSGTAVVGEDLVLTCDVEGSPPPTVAWTIDEKPISQAIDSHRLAFSTIPPMAANSTITISKIVMADRGQYACTFSNHDDLVFNTTTYIRIKVGGCIPIIGTYAALWPLLGILSELVVLCVIIFVSEKELKNNFDESDTDAGTKGRK